MIGKSFSFLLVCFLSVCNFTLVFTPFLLVLFFITTSIPSLIQNLVTALQFIALFVNAGMIFYLMCDYMFGFSIKRIIKKCTLCKKEPEYAFLDYIFEEVKKKFCMPNAMLLIKNSNEVNAFAVASSRRKYVVLTRGIVHQMSKAANNPQEFKDAICAIMGHEMAHLANKDFLPGLLIAANRSITSKLNVVSLRVFGLFISIIKIVPFIGRKIAWVLNFFSLKLHAFTHWFYRNVVMRFYIFLKRWIGRGIEYRCDYESARAFGSEGMIKALEFLGDKYNYFSIFSTHPTIARRIKSLADVKTLPKEKPLKLSIFTRFSNNLVFFMPFTLFLLNGTGVQLNTFTRSFLETKEFYHNYYVKQAKVLSKVQRDLSKSATKIGDSISKFIASGKSEEKPLQ